MDVSIWLLSIIISFTFMQVESCKKDTRCKISRIHGMKGADCFNKNLREFPQCLSSDMQIIDLSYNRIRKLNKNDLTRYSDLRVLYLSDNMIGNIDPETFEGKDDLQALDLALNGLSKLPPVVFHLPSLQSLYLGQNLNMNIADVVEKAKPVTSPLVQLDLSYVMSEEPNELPNFDVLPYLVKYNISGNKIINVTTKLFAGLCSLKVLDTTNTSAEYAQPCDCWNINRWLKSRKVNFNPFACEIRENECLDGVPIEDMNTYKECLQKKEKNEQRNRMVKNSKIIIPVVVFVIIVLIAVIYYYIRRRNKIKKQNQRQIQAEEQTLYENGFFNKT